MDFDWNNAFNTVTGVAKQYVDYDLSKKNAADSTVYAPGGQTAGGGINPNVLVIAGVVAVCAIVAVIVIKK